MTVFKHFSALRLIVVLLALTISACASGPQLSPLSEDDKKTFASDGLLRLEPGDKINLKVYGEESLSGEYMIDEDGNINVPLAGLIKAGGNTKSALQKTIVDSLKSQGFQQQPYVTVEVSALRPIFINGEVRGPGAYPYAPGLDLFQTIAMAGGYTPRASTSSVVITRSKQGKRIRFRATQDTPVWPGDSILVSQRLF